MHTNSSQSPFGHQPNQYKQPTQESSSPFPILPYQVVQQNAQGTPPQTPPSTPFCNNSQVDLDHSLPSTPTNPTTSSNVPESSPPPQMVATAMPSQQSETSKKVKRKTHPLLQAGSILSLWAEAAEVLIDCDNGDAALLYFHILKHNNPYPEKWDKYRAEKAQDMLHDLGLFDKKEKKKEDAPPQPVFLAPAAPPTYSQSDINLRLQDKNQAFPQLLEWAQAQFGKAFSRPETESLLRLYEHMAMPPESIHMLISWCLKEHREKNGQYSHPAMSYVEGVGRNWVNAGVVSYESVASKIEAMGQNTLWEKRLLKLFKLQPHVFVDSTKQYTDVWQTWNFSDEVLLYVYDITVSNLNSFKWAYANTILKDWHEKGLKTVAEIKEKDKNLGPRPQNASGKSGQAKGQNGPRKAETRATSFQSEDDMDIFWKSVEESRHKDGNQN